MNNVLANVLYAAGSIAAAIAVISFFKVDNVSNLSTVASVEAQYAEQADLSLANPAIWEISRLAPGAKGEDIFTYIGNSDSGRYTGVPYQYSILSFAKLHSGDYERERYMVVLSTTGKLACGDPVPGEAYSECTVNGYANKMTTPQQFVARVYKSQPNDLVFLDVQKVNDFLKMTVSMTFDVEFANGSSRRYRFLGAGGAFRQQSDRVVEYQPF